MATICKNHNTCSGAVPFYMGWNNPNYPYHRFGYAPAYCDYCPNFVAEDNAEVQDDTAKTITELKLTIDALVKRSHIHEYQKPKPAKTSHIKGAE